MKDIKIPLGKIVSAPTKTCACGCGKAFLATQRIGRNKTMVACPWRLYYSAACGRKARNERYWRIKLGVA